MKTDERFAGSSALTAAPPASAFDPPNPSRATSGLAPANVSGGHPPDLEDRGSARHNRILSGKLAQRLFVIGLDNRETVGVLLGEDRPEHHHVAALEVRAPVSSMAA